MSARHYTSADSPSDVRRTISLANRDCSCGAIHPPEASMSEGHGIMSARHYTRCQKIGCRWERICRTWKQERGKYCYAGILYTLHFWKVRLP